MTSQMNQEVPPLNIAVQAAVEQEARFKTIEAGLVDCRRDQTHAVELFDLRLQELTSTLQRDKADLDRRHDELFKVAKKALEASEKTNGSVAAAVLQIGQLASQVGEHALDIEELSGGLQAVRSAQATRDGKDGKAEARREGFWEALGLQWKILLGLAAASGAILTVVANITTVAHYFK